MNSTPARTSAGTNGGAILIVPACEAGRGGGHLYRSAALAAAVRAGGGRAWLSLPSGMPFWNSLCIDEKAISGTDWSLIVLDKFRTGKEEVRRWSALAPVLGIDEGCSRDTCDFLFDLLPGISGEAPNLCAPSLLPLPQKRRPSFYGGVLAGGALSGNTLPGDTFKILLCFGAEDPAGLTLQAAPALQNCGKNGTVFSLTVAVGPLCRDAAGIKDRLEKTGVTVLSAPALGEILSDYDLLVTHFGIAAFEALYARLPVLLLNPGTYHEKLSFRAGFVSAGSGTKGAARLGRLFGADFTRTLEGCTRQSEAAARRWGLEERGDLAAFLRTSAPRVYRSCPLCGAPSGSKKSHPPFLSIFPGCFTACKTARFPGRTYRRCSCGTFYMNRLNPPPVSYNRSYFFEAYRKQYGKTYLEDFPQLKKTGERRLERICALLPDIKRNAPNTLPTGIKRHAFNAQTPAPRLLDLGCAYGPFLAAAKERGFNTLGQDPSEDAAAYVRDKLGIRALGGKFPEDVEQIIRTLEPGESFDVITLWYVIEHFTGPGKALCIINGLLKMGGILAFSTPSAAGISRRKSLRSFLEQSPADHFTIWDPRRCGRILRSYGFRLKKTVITGHHPERFPLAGRLKPGAAPYTPTGIFYRVGVLVSRIFRLGDTFEAYAVKTGNPAGQKGAFHG